MRHNRSTIEIVSQILETANCGNRATKSEVMFGAHLTRAQLKEYLTVLTKNNLLDCDVETQTFKTTERGHRFLSTYNQTEAIAQKHINRGDV